MNQSDHQFITDWKWRSLISALLMFSFHFNVMSNDVSEHDTEMEKMTVSMTVTPDQCVAMTEGQTCYVDIEIKWQSSNVGDFCLFRSGKEGAIRCWSQKSQGEFQQEMASKTNVVFSLHRQQDLLLLTKTEVVMAWIHQKRGKPTNWWRLF